MIDSLLNSNVDVVSISEWMCVKLRLMHMMYGSAFWDMLRYMNMCFIFLMYALDGGILDTILGITNQ